MRVSLKFEPRDLWVGLYLDTYGRAAYLCVVPMLPLVIRWGPHRVRCPLRVGEVVPTVVHDDDCLHAHRVIWDGRPIRVVPPNGVRGHR